MAKWLAVLIVSMIAAAVSGQQIAPKITNQDVIEMVGMGLSDEVVIDKINASDTTAFDTSVPGLQLLKASKVSDAVIRAMINSQAPAARILGCASPQDSMQCREQEASTLQSNVITIDPSERVTAVGDALVYTEPVMFQTHQQRANFYGEVRERAWSRLCRLGFTRIRVETEPAVGEEFDLKCTSAKAPANEPGPSTASEAAVPKAQELAATTSQGQLSKADKKKESKSAKARKAFAEELHQERLKAMANNPVPGFNITAEGPDATSFVVRTPGTYDQCKALTTLEALRTAGFTRVVCITDPSTTFTFDLAPAITNYFVRWENVETVTKPSLTAQFGCSLPANLCNYASPTTDSRRCWMRLESEDTIYLVYREHPSCVVLTPGQQVEGRYEQGVITLTYSLVVNDKKKQLRRDET